jgi:hypothetical protein
MKNVLFAIVAMLAIAGCGVPDAPVGHLEQAMKCAPTDVNCVGDPGGVVCGHHHEICCGINGSATDCVSSQACNPTSYTCVNSIIPCTVTCANPAGVFINFTVGGSQSSGDVYTTALWYCLGASAYYVRHTCTY